MAVVAAAAGRGAAERPFRPSKFLRVVLRRSHGSLSTYGSLLLTVPAKQMTNPRVPLQRSDDHGQWQNHCDSNSSHKYIVSFRSRRSNRLSVTVTGDEKKTRETSVNLSSSTIPAQDFMSGQSYVHVPFQCSCIILVRHESPNLCVLRRE